MNTSTPVDNGARVLRVVTIRGSHVYWPRNCARPGFDGGRIEGPAPDAVPRIPLFERYFAAHHCGLS